MGTASSSQWESVWLEFGSNGIVHSELFVKHKYLVNGQPNGHVIRVCQQQPKMSESVQKMLILGSNALVEAKNGLTHRLYITAGQRHIQEATRATEWKKDKLLLNQQDNDDSPNSHTNIPNFSGNRWSTIQTVSIGLSKYSSYRS